MLSQHNVQISLCRVATIEGGGGLGGGGGVIKGEGVSDALMMHNWEVFIGSIIFFSTRGIILK